MFVDSHCHLAFPDLAARIEEIRVDMAAAQNSGSIAGLAQFSRGPRVNSSCPAFTNIWWSGGAT